MIYGNIFLGVEIGDLAFLGLNWTELLYMYWIELIWELDWMNIRIVSNWIHIYVLNWMNIGIGSTEFIVLNVATIG